MSAVEEYLKANGEFEGAKKALDEIGSMLREFGDRLKHYPEKTYFSNSGVGLPPDIVMSGTAKSLDAHVWPSPDQIQTAIARRFAAKRRVQSAWAAVPDAMRASLIAPKL